MEFPLNELIEIISSEIGQNTDLRMITNIVRKHPLIKNEYENMELEQLGLLIYSIYFISNGRNLEVLRRLRENMVFYISYEFEYAETRYVTCDYCYGNGEETCTECDGEGEVNCTECGGTGTVDGDGEESGECGYCDGKGEESCDECGGDGKVECSNCGGNGEVDGGLEIDYTAHLYVSILPLSTIERMEQSSGELTTDFVDEIDKVSNLTVILTTSAYSNEGSVHDDDSIYYDIEENTEMFYEVVNGGIKVREVHYPQL